MLASSLPAHAVAETGSPGQEDASRRARFAVAGGRPIEVATRATDSGRGCVPRSFSSITVPTEQAGNDVAVAVARRGDGEGVVGDGGGGGGGVVDSGGGDRGRDREDGVDGSDSRPFGTNIANDGDEGGVKRSPSPVIGVGDDALGVGRMGDESGKKSGCPSCRARSSLPCAAVVEDETW